MPHTAVNQTEETESQLVQRAQTALSECRWTVGECAAKWTRRFARGRTDADFAALIGLSADQVFQRRRVWEVFGETRETFAALKWSHFYTALAWDDAALCLGWAEENQSTVAEMRAWRRAQHGEDLTEPAEPDPDERAVLHVPTEATPVLNPESFRTGTGGLRAAGSGADEPVMAGFAREFDPQAGGDSPPFDAKPVPTEQQPHHDKPSPEQVVARMASQIERCLKILTPEFCREFRKVPKPVRTRFLQAAAKLGSRAAELG